MIAWIKKYEGLILILGLLVLLRIPSLYEPAWYGDENIYLTIGQGIRKGLVLYKDITDYPNKPPLIYLVAAIAGSVFWFRMILLVWNLIHAIVVYWLLKVVLPQKKWVWYVFTLAFVLVTSLPMLEGNIANGEMFMIMPTTVAMLLLWQAKSKELRVKGKFDWTRYFLAGVLFGVGFLFKIPVAADILAAGLFFFVLPRLGRVKELIRITTEVKFYVWILGIVVPIVVALGWHALQGIGPQTLLSTVVGSTKYVSAWQQGLTAWLGLSTLAARLAAAVMVTGALLLARRRLTPELLLASLWLTWALFGALLSGRPYPHYFLQLVPPLVLLGAVGVTKGWDIVHGVTLVGALVLVVGAYVRFHFSIYPIVDYYPRFLQYIAGQVSFLEFADRFDRRMSRNYQVAAYLRSHTLAGERIYVWGTEPDIYVLADRLPVGRLTTSFHVEDLNEYDRLGQELTLSSPSYMVVMKTEPRDFPQLMSLIEAKYILVQTIGEAEIYRRWL